MTIRVLVVGGDVQIETMFSQRGWQTTRDVKETEVSLVCFTGGEDVSPHLYNEKILPRTMSNFRRDQFEGEVFKNFKRIPKVGICRGGQFLNVMSGGAMWQDVDQHTQSHDLVDLLTEKLIRVTSTHHQMMIAGDEGEVIASAKRASFYLSANKEREAPEFDTEVVWYKSTNSLCFQPHPEYGVAGNPCREYFFDLIEHFWDYKKDK